MKVSEIERINTPEGGWKGNMPGPFLIECEEPLTKGAPDLRGTWRVIDVQMNGVIAPDTVPIWRHTERIEQAGDRAIVVSDGLIHDFISVDGTFENGCHDVAASDFTTPIVVAGSFEDGVFVMRPQGMDGVEVRRWLDGEHLIWEYASMFTARLERT